MRFKTGDAVCTNARGVNGAARQINSVARVRGDFLIGLRKNPRDAARQDVQHFVERMSVRAVFIKGSVGPCAAAQIFRADFFLNDARVRRSETLPACYQKVGHKELPKGTRYARSAISAIEIRPLKKSSNRAVIHNAEHFRFIQS